MDRKVETYISVLLPLVSIIAAGWIFFNPDITGFAVSRDEYFLNASIRVVLSEEVALTEAANILVYLDEKAYSMPAGDFLEKTGMAYRIDMAPTPPEGEIRKGFLGNGTYFLDIQAFGVDRLIRSGTHTLRTLIKDNNYIISENTQSIEV